MNPTTRNTIGIIVLIAIIIGSLGFFHIILAPFCMVPKEHFSFSWTFVDVDKVVERYNDRNVGERLRGDVLFDHLVTELESNNIIRSTEVQTLPDEKQGL